MLNQSLLDAYNQTNYYFDEILLNIDRQSTEAKSLLKPFTPKGGLFITAWNPLGKEVDLIDNELANKSLKKDLLSRGLTLIEGYGESLDGMWRENSFFAYPVDEDMSINLCHMYLQNAVVYVTSDGLPKLIFNINYTKSS